MNHLIAPQHGTRELWPMACFSALFHLVLFLLLLNVQFAARFKEAPVYYVDLLTLPVASPQAGTPDASDQPSAPPAPPAQAPPAPKEMVLPAKTPPKAPAKPPVPMPPKEADSAESSREFQDRLARLERDAGARHQADAVEALRQRRANGPVGMPGATGNQAGADYASYVQSRLRDAFRSTIAFQSRDPEVVVRITISRSGIITRVRTERSTGDKVFEDAVARAIAKAAQTIPEPPKGESFETGFVFRPQGVGKN